MLSHGNIVEDILCLRQHFLKLDLKIYSFLPLPIHHTYECTCGFIVPLYRGASIAFCEGLKYIVKNLGKHFNVSRRATHSRKSSQKIWQTAKKNGKDKALKKLISINNTTKK